ncbi:hypothetical protein F4805DRAFT_451780 [Annulohypoxylon moriforme]|nr:hypothetical protein F4805DRAFT_451780 [Annulohypoxylon moriforme]
MDALDHPILHQPNFDIMTQSLTTFSQEFAKCANIPAIRQGNDILALLQEMRIEMRGDIQALSNRVDNLSTRVDHLSTRVDDLSTRVDGLTDRVDNLTGRVDGITNRMIASDANSIARLINNGITAEDTKITPLKSIFTNEPIPELTDVSIDMINGWNNHQLDRVLMALGQTAGRTADSKRRQLFLSCGLLFQRR